MEEVEKMEEMEEVKRSKENELTRQGNGPLKMQNGKKGELKPTFSRWTSAWLFPLHLPHIREG